MNAAKTGLPEYDGPDIVYAAKITAIEPLQIPGMPGCQRLKFDDLGKQANMVPEWVSKNAPQIGGYFVVTDAGARYMDGTAFSQAYKESAS